MEQRLSDGINDPRVTEAAKSFNSGGAHMMVAITDAVEQRGGGFGIAELAQGFHGSDADMAVFVPQRVLKRFESALVFGLAQGLRGGVTSRTCRVAQGAGKNFDRSSAVDGDIFVLRHGNGAKNKFGVAAGPPAECFERGGCLP